MARVRARLACGPIDLNPIDMRLASYTVESYIRTLSSCSIASRMTRTTCGLAGRRRAS